MNNSSDPSASSRNVVSFSDSLERYLAEKLENVQRQLPRILPELRQAGVVRVVATYDGCGDSGQIESVTCYDAQDQAMPFPSVILSESQFTDLWYDLLESRHEGWEINDGAFGEFSWDLREGTLHHEHHDRYTDYTTTEHDGL